MRELAPILEKLDKIKSAFDRVDVIFNNDDPYVNTEQMEHILDDLATINNTSFLLHQGLKQSWERAPKEEPPSSTT